MKRKFDQVYQFKITLKYVKPPIWRRILVPENYSFRDLHIAIQDAMGWDDYHLHQFELADPSSGMRTMIGIPDDEFGGFGDILPGEKEKISKWFSLENDKAEYLYDFGDNWEHTVKLEKILPRETGIKYPKCTAGKLACPPEDCGGVWGYADLIEILNDPENEEYENMKEWIGDDFDPRHFNADEVIFGSSARR